MISFQQIDRMSLWSFLRSFCFSTLLLMSLYLVIEIFTLGRHGKREEIYLYLYILTSLPRFFSYSLSFGLMLGSCYYLSQCALSGELTAVSSLGCSLFRFIRWILLAAIFFGLLQFTITEFLTVPMRQKSNYFKSQYADRHPEKEKTQLYHSQNIRIEQEFYYIHLLNPSKKTIEGGFTYFQFNKQDRPIVFHEAESGFYQPQSGNWVFRKVRSIYFKSHLEIDRIEKKEQMSIRLHPDFLLFFLSSKPFNEMSIIELYRQIQTQKKLGLRSVRLTLEFHNRFAFPVLCLLLTLTGCIIGAFYCNPRMGGSMAQSFIFCVIVSFSYYALFSIGLSLASHGLIATQVVSWGPVLMYALLTWILLQRSRK